MQKARSSSTGLGDRLRAARDMASLTTRTVAQELLAAGVPVTHVTVSNFELGKSTPSPEILSELCRIYGKTVRWFYEPTENLSGVRYRALAAITSKQRRDYELNVQCWMSLYRHLESLLSESLRTKHEDFIASENDSGATIAKKLREIYKLGDLPLPNAIKVLEDFGIRVVFVRSDLRIDALAARLGKYPIVALNSELPSDRIRLNALHELAHHIFRDCIRDELLSHDEVERRAFEFASHVLIPPDMLRSAFDSKRMVRLVQYKERYGISLAAMIYRAKQDNLITDRLYRRIWKEFGRLGIRKTEPGHVIPDYAVRLEAMIEAAINDKLATISSLSEVSGIPAVEIQSRWDTAMGGVRVLDAAAKASDSFRIEDYRRVHEDRD